MKIRISTLLLTIAVFLLLCERSFESILNRKAIDLNRSPPESPPPERSRSRSPPVKYYHDAKPSARIIVPPTRLPSNDGLGYELAEIDFIRLSPRANEHRVFQFGRFNFPRKTSVKLKTPKGQLVPVSGNEQIVMLTSDGDVFAILETTDILAGLYMHFKHYRRRAKINMRTNIVKPLTSAETKEIPVGSIRHIMYDYEIYRENCV